MIAFFVLICSYSIAQNSLNIIASSGDRYELNGLSLEWTLGESFVSPHSINGLKLEEGFHALAIKKSNSTFVKDVESFKSLNLYPNPANSYIQFSEGLNIKSIINAYIIDQSGSLIRKMDIDSNKIDLPNLQSGSYYLVLVDLNKVGFVGKFIFLK